VLRPTILLLVTAGLVSAQAPLSNDGKPMRVPFECMAADTQAAGLGCTEEDPCPVYLELANIEAVGNKIFVPGNFHTSNATLSSILLLSEDSGATWIEPHARMRFSGLDQIQFIDFQNGWITGANLQGSPRDPFLLITTDGGKTWRERPLFEENRVAVIERFWFDSPANGSLLVDARLDNGKRELYETRTGGESWAMQQASADPIRFPHGRESADPAWRLRADAATHSYEIERRESNHWQKVASFLVNVTACKE
jgi:hypothetical protein